MKLLITFLATGFYFGKAKYFPGTFGTLPALPLYYFISSLDPIVQTTIILIVVAFSIFVATVYSAQFKDHDRQEIVIDEIAGFLVTMALIPFSLKTLIAGFLIFRVLDMTKPFPISYIDKNMKGGVGVVADDILAGIIGNIVLQVILQNTGWLNA